MQLTDDVMLLMAKERTEEAMRIIGQTRALRRGRVSHPPFRTRLGAALIRLGTLIGGRHLTRSSPAAEGAVWPR